MNKIEKMIKELCPNGVEWKKIGEIATLVRGKVISKDYLQDNEGEYPVYSSQTANNGELGRIDTYMFDGKYLTWTTDGAYAGTVFKREGKFNITNVCGLIDIKDEKSISLDYVYYTLAMEAPKYVLEGMGNPKLMSNVMEKVSIPLPPLPIQTGIVRILDKFVEQQEQLERLIELRKKQYEYYREEMLKPKEGEKWEKVIMSDVCDLKAGKAISASELNDSNAYPCYGGNGIRGYISKYSHEGNFAIIGRQGALCGCVNWATKKFYATEHAVVVTPKNGNDSRFLYLLFTRANLNQYKSAGAQPGLAVNKLNELYFTIPSSKKQKQIVKILDFYETSIATLTTALELSKKRYEYYMDKMLNF